MRCSVIIVTYNSEKHIYDCLRSLFQYNDLGDQLEVIVVDNCSAQYQQMRERIRQEYGDRVIIVQNQQNGGYGQGNNVGIRLATAPVIAIMNPDVRLVQPILMKLVGCFDDPNVLMSGCKQVFPNGKQGWSFACNYAICEPLRILLRRIGLRKDRFNDKYMYLSGAFFMLRKNAFQEIGMYDENLFMYAEEPDIFIRFRRHFPQMKICYLPQLKYLHDHTKRAYSQERQRNVINGDVYVYQKHGISTDMYFCTNILLSYIFQMRALLKRNRTEATECKMSRSVLREEKNKIRKTK